MFSRINTKFLPPSPPTLLQKEIGATMIKLSPLWTAFDLYAGDVPRAAPPSSLPPQLPVLSPHPPPVPLLPTRAFSFFPPPLGPPWRPVGCGSAPEGSPPRRECSCWSSCRGCRRNTGSSSRRNGFPAWESTGRRTEYPGFKSQRWKFPGSLWDSHWSQVSPLSWDSRLSLDFSRSRGIREAFARDFPQSRESRLSRDFQPSLDSSGNSTEMELSNLEILPSIS